MIAIVAPAPVGAPGLAVLWIAVIAFAAALLWVRLRHDGRAETGVRAAAPSRLGIGLQAAAFLVVAMGPLRTTLQASSAAALGQAVVVAMLAGGCIGMFLSAATAMGANWSLAARTRRDHELVTWGPFATIRHPIYTGLFALLLAFALAFGHWRGLILALPLFAWGTWIRVQAEEHVLHVRFGREYEAYAARVKRFLPRLF